MVKVVALVAVLCVLSTIECNPVGPPVPDACDRMTPGHTPNMTQTILSPYEVVTSAKDGYVPRGEYNITIRQSGGGTSDNFKGFLCQVRPQDLSYSPQGSFVVFPTDPKAQTLSCPSAAAAAGHKNPSVVQSQTLTWRAPAAGQGNLTILCSVVKEYTTFWVKIPSDVLVELPGPTGVTEPPTTPMPPTTKAPTQAQPNLQIDFSGCGTTTFCYQDPLNCMASNCEYGLTVSTDGTKATITLSTTNDGMVALGFSEDTLMGEDDVVGCIRTTAGIISAHDGWNPSGRSPNRLDTKEDLDDATSFGSFLDGVLSCRIVRDLNTGNDDDYNWNQNWTLLFAHRPSEIGSPFPGFPKHGEIPKLSTEKVNISRLQGVSASSSDKVKFVRAHGILMIIAWIGIASTGILLARFYKRVYPKEEPALCFSGSPPAWFQLHRLHMISTVLISAVGFIVIFAGVKAWTSSGGDKKLAAHPIIGTICMAFALAQPIMAAFRCHPGEKNRFIFNIAHALVGSSALILGIVNVYLGVIIAEDVINLDSSPLYILIAWTVVMFTIELCLEIKAFCDKPTNSGDMEMKASGASGESSAPPPPSGGPSEDAPGKRVVLVIYIAISLSLAIAMAIVVGVS
eukprot:m.230142 g.230142  ORF g.230142 m.230142 type:complete len:625 (+) comp40056_c0_seq25:68-1942(+)